MASNQYTEALAKFREAMAADPLASIPVSWAAGLFLQASEMTSKENVEPYRTQARELASKALDLNASNPLALEILRKLDGKVAPDLNLPKGDALALFNEAEVLFQKQDFKAALLKYEACAAKSPGFAKAVLYAGDCHFAMGAYAEAEKQFLKAGNLDPTDAQAWRFHADALAHLNRPKAEIRSSLLRAIQAQPMYLPAWNQLESLMGVEGTELKVFEPVLMAQASIQKGEGKGKIGIRVAEGFSKDGPEAAAWVAFAIAQGSGLLDPKPGEVKKSPFEIELSAWETTLRVLAELDASQKVKDKTLLTMARFQAAGHLKAALFLFLFKEDYRADYESWKASSPNGISEFVDTYHLRPRRK